MAVFNVRDYGATGNGVSNDRLKIQDAVNAASRGDAIYFPAGTYVINQAPVQLPGGMAIYSDEGAIVTVGNLNDVAFYLSGTQHAFTGLTMSLEAISNFRACIENAADDVTIQDCSFLARLDGVATNNQWTNHCIYSHEATNLRVARCTFDQCQIKCGGGLGGVADVLIYQCSFARPLQYAVSAVSRQEGRNIERVNIVECTVIDMVGSGGFYIGAEPTSPEFECNDINIVRCTIDGTHAEQTKYIHSRPRNRSKRWTFADNHFDSLSKAHNSYGIRVQPHDSAEDFLDGLNMVNNHVFRTDHEGILVDENVTNIFGFRNYTEDTRDISVNGVTYPDGYWP